MLLDKLRTLLQLQQRPYPAEQRGLRVVIDEAAAAWPFTEAALDFTPSGPGVYFLYAMGRLVYIGVALRSTGLREELASHLRGAHGVCTREATAFTCEPVLDPLPLYRRYLQEHRTRYGGRLPACNSPTT
jgi:hypothetical protein